jgi:hypothetical protein
MATVEDRWFRAVKDSEGKPVLDEDCAVSD